jgi:hypothetical protein
VKESGFATKKEAQDAEAVRRVEEQKRVEMSRAGRVDATLPKTLAMLFAEYFLDQEQKPEGSNRLALKTLERYREQAAYLSPDLLDMVLADITPVHLNREWNRLIESGGHHRKTGVHRPLSPKTVRKYRWRGLDLVFQSHQVGTRDEQPRGTERTSHPA